jgi:hypothetical protein
VLICLPVNESLIFGLAGCCSNKDILAVNADSLGRMGRRFSVSIGSGPAETAHGEGWRKDLANGDVAVVLFNPSEEATKLAFTLQDVGFAPDTIVHAR